MSVSLTEESVRGAIARRIRAHREEARVSISLAMVAGDREARFGVIVRAAASSCVTNAPYEMRFLPDLSKRFMSVCGRIQSTIQRVRTTSTEEEIGSK